MVLVTVATVCSFFYFLYPEHAQFQEDRLVKSQVGLDKRVKTNLRIKNNNLVSLIDVYVSVYQCVCV